MDWDVIVALGGATAVGVMLCVVPMVRYFYGKKN